MIFPTHFINKNQAKVFYYIIRFIGILYQHFKSYTNNLKLYKLKLNDSHNTYVIYYKFQQ